ncbi:DUF2141 domain-containing protein [Sphingobium chlorophenolicum]|uniref:DUF2141 domain-containing protein n=1 Tax=Sphingobium chlorophenolicum TaxID=46429 RepID=A0A081RCG0_SPHCR|nr:DUF2141 domain-containing protein [Sphingobium chlorophenolicum]KEQ52883.1 hypothetical protein BV95_02794 [Sphingobium chlorophenolicum]
MFRFCTSQTIGLVHTAAVSLWLFASPAQAGDLEVKAEHITPGPGSIHVVLYRGAAGFRHEDHAFRVLKAPASSVMASVRFQALPPGDYAVMVYHDANSNDKLDLRFGMFPTEGWGLSNNPRVIGPPSFNASKLTVDDQNRSIMIDLHY